MKSTIRFVIAATALWFQAATLGQAMAAVVETSDYIGSPSHFNGFENAGPSEVYGLPYTEDGITVNQLGVGASTYIWADYDISGTAQGRRAWFPAGGDNGYTAITLQSGEDFQDISFLAGSGYSSDPKLYLYYELLLDHRVVQSGVLAHSPKAHWLGFSGGGFDEVRLRDGLTPNLTLLNGQKNGFAIDSIKVASAVPEPGMLGLWAMGLLLTGLVSRGRHHRQR